MASKIERKPNLQRTYLSVAIAVALERLSFPEEPDLNPALNPEVEPA